MTRFKKGLSLLAAVAFLITALLPVSGLAETPYDPVKGWEKAFQAVEGQAGMYRLTDNATIDNYVRAPEGKISLDLNGCTLTCTDDLAIQVVSSQLTIMDSKNNGAIAGASRDNAFCIAVWDTGSLILESGTIKGGKADGAVIQLNGRTAGQQASLEVKGGTIDGGTDTIAISANFGAEVNISGGTVRGSTAIFQNGNANTETQQYRENPSYVTISGGTVEGTDPTLSGQAGITWQNKGTLTVDGGTIIAQSGPGVLVRDGVANINGGTITTHGEEPCTEGDSGGQIPPAPVVWDEGEKSKANYLKGGDPAEVTVANGVKLDPKPGVPAMAHVTGGNADGKSTVWNIPEIQFPADQTLSVNEGGTVSPASLQFQTDGWNWTATTWNAAQQLLYPATGDSSAQISLGGKSPAGPPASTGLQTFYYTSLGPVANPQNITGAQNCSQVQVGTGADNQPIVTESNNPVSVTGSTVGVEPKTATVLAGQTLPLKATINGSPSTTGTWSGGAVTPTAQGGTYNAKVTGSTTYTYTVGGQSASSTVTALPLVIDNPAGIDQTKPQDLRVMAQTGPGKLAEVVPALVDNTATPAIPQTGLTYTWTITSNASGEPVRTVSDSAVLPGDTWSADPKLPEGMYTVSCVVAAEDGATSPIAAPASIEIRLYATPEPAVRITPSEANVLPGGSATFTVELTSASGAKDSWSIDGAPTMLSGATADSVTVTVPENATGPYKLTYTTSGDNPLTGTATISVTPFDNVQVIEPGDEGAEDTDLTIDPGTGAGGEPPVLEAEPTDWEDGQRPTVALTPVAGVEYSWSITEAAVTESDGTVENGASITKAPGDGNRAYVPNQVGSYRITVTVRNRATGETYDRLMDVVVKGTLTPRAVLSGPARPQLRAAVDAPVIGGSATIDAGWGQIPTPPGPDNALYLWMLTFTDTAPEGSATLSVPNGRIVEPEGETCVLKAGETAWILTTGSSMIRLDGVGKGDQIGGLCTVYAPDPDGNNTIENLRDNGRDLAETLLDYTLTQPAISDVTNGDASLGDPDGNLYGWIGQPLDQTAGVSWAGNLTPNVGYWIMRPADTAGTVGQEITVTASRYNANQLTFRTNAPLVGDRPRSYEYWLIAYTGAPGEAGSDEIARIRVTLNVDLLVPSIAGEQVVLAPGLNSVNAAEADPNPYCVYATYGYDRGTLYTQTSGLPSIVVNAQMESGNASGWAATQWAISDQPFSYSTYLNGRTDTPAEREAYQKWMLDKFAKVGQADSELQAVSGGASTSGDLTSTYQVQPAEIAEAVRVNEANSVNTGAGSATWLGAPFNNGTFSLYYYAKVQYGSNPNCARVITVPFQLCLCHDSQQALLPLDGQGQISSAQTTIGSATLRKADITALVNSGADTELNTMWIPDMAPRAVTGYTWTYVSGPGSLSAKGGVRSPGDTWDDGQNGKASSFTAKGRYILTCQPAGTSTAPVAFEVNVSDIAVGTWEDQAEKFAAWAQPADGYFTDTASAPAFSDSMAPQNPANRLGTLGSLLTIGNVTANGLSVTATTPVPGETAPVSVDGRFQLHFDPSGIQYGNGADGEPRYLSGNPADASYWQNLVSVEWRYKPGHGAEDDGNGLTIPADMGFSGVNSLLLTSGPLTAEMDGWQFGLEIHDRNNDSLYTTTRWVLLDLDGISPATEPVPTIASWPAASGSNVETTAGSSVTLAASAQASIPASALKWQWQSRPAASASAPDPKFADIEGATDAAYSIETVADADNGVSYRCVVTNTAFSGGVSVASAPLTLKVGAANGSIVIAAPQAASLTSLYASRTFEAEVDARTDNGDDVTCQWYVKSFIGKVPTGSAAADTMDEAAALIAASGSRMVDGATSAELVTSPLEEGVYEYTCRVVNAKDATKVMNSAPCYVVVTENSRRPFISVPAAPDTGVVSVGTANGRPVSLKCEAWIASGAGEGETLAYQWQTSSSARGPWSSVTSATGTSETLQLDTVTPQYTGTYYRCVVTNTGAGESATSVPYLLNVWNVAEVPTITRAPQDQQVAWTGSVPGNEIALTSVATVPQGADHNEMTPCWSGPQAPAGGWTPQTNATGAAQVSSTRTVSGGVVTYTSTLSIPVGSVDEARKAIGDYTVTWFNNQAGNQDTSGARPEQNMVQPADTTSYIAPQATSAAATVDIQISGTPRIATQSALAVTRGVGETAQFSVTALLNEDQDTVPKGSLVYVWQMTRDGGATWTNATSADGTGQFTDTFTTIPLTETMYDNSTASNVAGTGTAGTVGNARTVYEYRCIVANRTTGMKAPSKTFNLTITPGSSEPVETPVIRVVDGADVEIRDNGELGKILVGSGLTATKDGNAVSTLLAMVEADPDSGDYEIRVVNSEDDELGDDDIVGTGMRLRLVDTADGDKVLDTMTVIVRGDVMGTGRISLTQLVKMAAAFRGGAEQTELEGPYLLAGNLAANDDPVISLTDLVQEASIYRHEILEPEAQPTAEPTASQTAEPTAEPTASQTTEPTAEPTASQTAAPTEAGR